MNLLSGHVGSSNPPTSSLLSSWLFLRLLGVVYLAAFLSLAVQIEGLVGSWGILPAGEYLSDVRAAIGPERYYLVPTLCWLDAGDGFLMGLCFGGALLAGLLILGVAPVVVLILLWAFYLSLTVVGQEFLSYQWDGLLLEAGFLAIFLVPAQLWPRLSRTAPPSRIVLWLFRWLLFRLMFSSGIVKLLSGDGTWRSLTALEYHYQTQPLPPWTSWYMHQLPAWFQQISVVVTFVAELLLPLFLFGPRRWRHVACAGIAVFQLLIAATGNYGFFNLLSLVLCVPLLDDALLPAVLRSRRERRGSEKQPLSTAEPIVIGGTAIAPAGAAHRPRWHRYFMLVVAAVVMIMSVMPFVETSGLLARGPAVLEKVYRAIASFRSVNACGLFAIMTTKRPEIIVEGSDDGVNWLTYEFKWKPGDLTRRPAFTTPHLPRLDWQMWFAAIGRYQQNPWFIRFLTRLLEGSPEVLGLIVHNPFPDRPPRFIRAFLYEYHFTDAATRRETGAWWRRELLGLYCPTLTVASGG
jgi:hypothetical protein